MTEERQEESLLRNKQVQQTDLSRSSEEPSLTREEEEMAEKQNIPFSDIYLSSNRLHSHVVHDTKWPPPVPPRSQRTLTSQFIPAKCSLRLLTSRFKSTLPAVLQAHWPLSADMRVSYRLKAWWTNSYCSPVWIIPPLQRWRGCQLGQIKVNQFY